jgi:hypothetical protein
MTLEISGHFALTKRPLRSVVADQLQLLERIVMFIRILRRTWRCLSGLATR